MLETQNYGNKTSSGEIGLNIRTHASPEVGQDQVSDRISGNSININTSLD